MQDGTYSINQGELYLVRSWTTGYWVAQTNNTYVPKTYQEQVEYAQVMMDRYGTPFVGVWTDKAGDIREPGDTYFDATHHVEDLIQAVAMARHWNQKSIWDIKHGYEIYVR